MNELELTIINHLKTWHKGKGNAIHYKNLAEIFELHERELRDIVADLITDYEIPIGSSQVGYWWIANHEEYKEAHDELIARMKKLSRRAKGLRHGFEKSQLDYKFEQPKLMEVKIW
jgi:hypothetical protein